jgi:hypothetical protein
VPIDERKGEVLLADGDDDDDGGDDDLVVLGYL